MRFACFLLIASTLYAADVAGTWKGQMDTGRAVVFQFKTEGNKVSGTMSGPNGEPRPITSGELKDDSISFTVASEWEGNPVKLSVKGTVTASEMKLTVSSEGGEWSTGVVAKKAG